MIFNIVCLSYDLVYIRCEHMLCQLICASDGVFNEYKIKYTDEPRKCATLHTEDPNSVVVKCAHGNLRVHCAKNEIR